MKQITRNCTATESVDHELKYILTIILEFINVMDTTALTFGVCRFFRQDCRHHKGKVLKGIKNQGWILIAVTSIILPTPMLVLPVLHCGGENFLCIMFIIVLE